jgi:mRNA interferase MazF
MPFSARQSGFSKNSHCPMKKGRLLASLPAHECCPLHDDSIQKKD